MDSKTGLLKSIGRYNQQLNKNVTINLNQSYYYYEGMSGNNEEFKNRSSGAYIFRPNGSEPVKIAEGASFKVFQGEQ